MEEELALKIAVDWVSSRPGCTPEQAHAVYGGARSAAKAILQAHKDWEATQILQDLEPESGEVAAENSAGGGNQPAGLAGMAGSLPST